jgi:hypothetical protein
LPWALEWLPSFKIIKNSPNILKQNLVLFNFLTNILSLCF